MTNNNSPINIDTSKLNRTCNLRCRLVCNYSSSNALITNGKYNKTINIPGISLGTYENIDKTNVLYNGINVTTNGIEPVVFVPSLHTYNNSKLDGELIIVHRSHLKNLVICIPIISGTGGTTLDEILSVNNLNTIPNNNNQTQLSTLYTLNDYIPLSKPYFVYSGNIFFGNREHCDYIVFPPKHAINISSNIINKIKDIFYPKNYKLYMETINDEESLTDNCPILYYNSKGAVNNEEDDIYIDCRPTGSGGAFLDGDSPENDSKEEDFDIPPEIDDLYKIITNLIYFIFGVFILYSIYSVVSGENNASSKIMLLIIVVGFLIAGIATGYYKNKEML